MAYHNVILLIDDDDDDKQLLDHTIKNMGPRYKVLQAGNGEEGLKLLNRLKTDKLLPCLIVLDLNMPKMDGKEAFVAIKSDPDLQKIPVTIFSTSSSELDKTFFRKHNTPYFVKPVSEKDLTAVASEMLRNCRQNT